MSSSSPLPPPILVYHESARSIVFRDHIRRQHSIIKKKQEDQQESTTGKKKTPTLSSSFEEKILNYTPNIDPLPALQSHAGDDFELLLEKKRDEEKEEEEDEVMKMMKREMCVVKTIRNADWTVFLKRLKESMDKGEGFKSSCSLLPSGGYKMRCFGSLKEYSTGVILPLPVHPDAPSEQKAIDDSQTFIWPAGYSAKTEFNIDHRGRLLNGREEALVTIKELRQLNDDYLHKTDYKLYNRLVKGGLTTIPYNELYINIGGSTSTPTYHTGLGPPIGLFCRTASYGDIIHLLRTRARYASTLNIHYSAISLYHLSPTHGLRPFTPSMEEEFWHYAASHLDPFQNPHIKHKTTITASHPLAMQQKLEELINLDEIRSGFRLTGDELARIAGGFGATDDSVAKLLMDVMTTTTTQGEGEGMNKLQEVVNDGLTSAVRAGDYHTSRQLLILYTLVATKGGYESDDNASQGSQGSGGGSGLKMLEMKGEETKGELLLIKKKTNDLAVAGHKAPLPPPPPPLDTERLRSATNSDGLLSVLGAADVLKAMQDGSAKRRMEEVIRAVEEWIEEGEQNMTFRLTSWHNQRVAQGDLQIATNKDTAFGAFISGKAVSNRRKFVNDLRHAISHAQKKTTTLKDDDDDCVENIFETVSFLHDIHQLCAELRSPCLRLELLQYILGLDNRYSVAHVARSVELAATCLNIRMAAGDDPGVVAVGDDGDHKVDDVVGGVGS